MIWVLDSNSRVLPVRPKVSKLYSSAAICLEAAELLFPAAHEQVACSTSIFLSRFQMGAFTVCSWFFTVCAAHLQLTKKESSCFLYTSMYFTNVLIASSLPLLSLDPPNVAGSIWLNGMTTRAGPAGRKREWRFYKILVHNALYYYYNLFWR